MTATARAKKVKVEALAEGLAPAFVLGPDEVATSGQYLAGGQVHGASLQRVACPSGHVLATWPALEQDESANYPSPVAGGAHFHGEIVAFAHAGERNVAAVRRDGTLRVVSLERGEELLRYDADNTLVDVAVDADGAVLTFDVAGRLIRLAPTHG